MVLDAASLSTQHYKVRIKGKVDQSREWSSALPYTLIWFGLVSLFNGISTLFRLFNAKAILIEEQ